MLQRNELKKAGLKVTLPRLKILEILESSELKHMSAEDIYKDLLETGEDIEGDYAGSLMAEVIDSGTELLSNEDRLAIADYLKSLKPIR